MGVFFTNLIAMDNFLIKKKKNYIWLGGGEEIYNPRVQGRWGVF